MSDAPVDAQVESVDLGDVTLSVRVVGEGPVVLCAHGFPDDAQSFRALIPSLVSQGFRVVCPTMRGYGPSGVARSGRYDAAALGADLCALAAHYAPREAVRLVGHDWGAVAAYAATALAPARFSHLVTLAVPHLRTVLRRGLSAAQLRRSGYIGFFQLPRVAEAALRARDLALIDRLWRGWSPSYRASPEALARIKEGIAPRVSEVLAYYRALTSPRALVGDARRLVLAKTVVPAMYLHGVEDGCMGVELLEGTEHDYEAGVSVHRVEGAGHFLHLEKPAIVGALMRSFFASPRVVWRR